MLHIALAKGRIAKTVMKRLAEGGFHFSDYSDESRKLIFTDDEERIRVTLVKSPDVAVYVRRGAADAGIVGKDVLMEDGEEDVYEVLDLGIGRCRMAVSGIKGNQKVMQKRILTVASKYPSIARKYFADRFQPIDIIKLNGSVELHRSSASRMSSSISWKRGRRFARMASKRMITSWISPLASSVIRYRIR